MGDNIVYFDDSLVFGKKGEEVLQKYLTCELQNNYKNKEFILGDVTSNRICQIAGLDFAIKNRDINSLADLTDAVLEAIEIKAHLWVKLDNRVADLAFETYSDYHKGILGWVDKSVKTIEDGILPFIRVFWINKDNLWIASIQINKNFCRFWKENNFNKLPIGYDKSWEAVAYPGHKLNDWSYDQGRKWQSSFLPIKVLALQREGIPYTLFQLKSIKEKKELIVQPIIKSPSDNPFFPPGEYKRLFGNEFTKEFFIHLQQLNPTTTCFMSRKYLKKNFEELEENEKYHLTVCGEIKGNE